MFGGFEAHIPSQITRASKHIKDGTHERRREAGFQQRMSLRILSIPATTATNRSGYSTMHERLAHVLDVGRRCLPSNDPHVDTLAALLSRLNVEQVGVNSGKRKVDGSRAATRIGNEVSERWANERFRQVMLLVLEFRREYENSSLLTAHNVESIRAVVDDALFHATTTQHEGDIYDLNPT